MIEVALAVVVTGILFLVVGIPFASALRQQDESWIAYATDSAAYGVVFLTLSLTAWNVFGIAGVILAGLVLAGFAVFAARRRVGFPRGSGRSERMRPSRVLVITWIVVVVVAVAFRLHDSTFLPWVGDMGAYVNWGNEFVRTGHLAASWPPVFSVFLAVGRAVLGISGTTAGIAFCGFLFIAVVARILTRIGINAWIVVGIAAAMAVNVHAIWYSYLPSSEALNAPVFVVWLMLFFALLNAERRMIAPYAVMTFLVMLDLCLLRASGSFLLVPLIPLALIMTIVPVWRRWARRTWVFAIATLAGAEAGIWYGVAVIPTYFVTTQVKQQLPSSVYFALKGAGVLHPGIRLAAVLLVVLALAVAASFWASRARRRTAERHPDGIAENEGGSRAAGVIALVGAIAYVISFVLYAAVGSNIWFIVWRMGVWLPVLTVVALVIVWRTRRQDATTAVLLLAAATALFLMAFQVHRLGSDRPHAFFLYWDRYLVSEVLPAMLVAAAIGAAGLLRFAKERWGERATGWMTARRSRAALPAVAVVLIGVVMAAANTPILVREAEDTYMAGAQDYTLKLASFTKTDDALVWAGTSTKQAAGFFFPNEWMAFAVPMQRSLGYDFINVRQGHDDFRPDEVPSAAELDADVAEHGTVYVYETQKSGRPLDERLASSDLDITRVGQATSDISLLEQRPQLQDWTHLHLHVIVWKVTKGS